MPVPIAQMYTVVSYLLRQRLGGASRYPLVLMLEPLYRCNLACAGCGKIQYPSNILKHQLSVEECMAAVEECGAPIVSIPGGEPLLHPQIGEIVAGLVERKKYIYLCTNALLLEEKLDLFQPSRYLSFSVHMDGLEDEHDRAVCREGTYQKARSAIESALNRGFRVTTNSTFFDGVDPARVRDFFDEMMKLGVEGMMLSPGYSYDKAANQDGFLERKRTENLFRQLFHEPHKSWRFNQSPLFLEFLAGGRSFDCTPWGNPTYSVFGWLKPCYLLQDGYEATFEGLLQNTEWSRYGPKSGNPACQNCMVHCGFEPTAVEQGFSSLGGFWEMARAAIVSPRIPAPEAEWASVEAPEAAATAQPPSQGWSSEASIEALREAFDYRGNVTFHFEDGSEIEGFVANLGEKELTIWPAGEVTPKQMPLQGIVRLTFTGKDPASGKSWQTWLKKQEAVQPLVRGSA
ncbi:MAG: adenosyl-hopene transferase HpnH [Deltaproteobacteria bacterium]|nr:adenosyl-hopene transferase HpnH [Deltaproteobacteria bacterium]